MTADQHEKLLRAIDDEIADEATLPAAVLTVARAIHAVGATIARAVAETVVEPVDWDAEPAAIETYRAALAASENLLSDIRAHLADADGATLGHANRLLRRAVSLAEARVQLDAARADTRPRKEKRS